MRLRLWVFFLSMSAGATNAGALLHLHFAASHHTGNLTALAIALANGHLERVLLLLGVLGAFLLGAVLGGGLFYRCVPGKNQRYGWIFLFLSLLEGLWIRHFGGYGFSPFLLFLALRLGLQNTILWVDGVTVTRTTHYTGYFTDLGLLLGEWLAGERHPRQRLLCHGMGILAFLLGAFLQACFFSSDSILLLWMSPGLLLGASVYYLTRCLERKKEERG